MKRVAAIAVLLALARVDAADCARGGLPGATLLVPYFRVSRNGVTNVSTDIPDLPEQTDTLLSLTNVSDSGLVVHATVWTKYGAPILGFNFAMTSKDVVTFRMKDILNGKLNVNPTTQLVSTAKDPCGINQTIGAYAPRTGFGATTYIRFPNPNVPDARLSISIYPTPAFSGEARKLVWDSLDESGDVTAFTAPGAFVIDDDNGGCSGVVDGRFSGDFSGYVTFDVVNYCTSFFPTDEEYWENDAISTAGWGEYSPNALIGDVFYVDSTRIDGNVSGDPMVALRFRPELGGWNGAKTFYGRYDTLHDDGASPGVPAAYRFIGDGREALGNRYAFRYLSDAAGGLQTWIALWRSDRSVKPSNGGMASNLCAWWAGPAPGSGPWDDVHEVVKRTFDSDENEFVTAPGPCCGSPQAPLYVFLESQRIDLLSNGDINAGGWKGGWIDIELPGSPYAQTFISVQHTGLARSLSVGHAAAPIPSAPCGP